MKIHGLNFTFCPFRMRWNKKTKTKIWVCAYARARVSHIWCAQYCADKHGIVSFPTITEYDYDPKGSQFKVSDGTWEFCSVCICASGLRPTVCIRTCFDRLTGGREWEREWTGNVSIAFSLTRRKQMQIFLLTLKH